MAPAAKHARTLRRRLTTLLPPTYNSPARTPSFRST